MTENDDGSQYPVQKNVLLNREQQKFLEEHDYINFSALARKRLNEKIEELGWKP